MTWLDKLKGNEGKKYQSGIRNENVFSIDKNYTLVEVITLLKYQAYMLWGSDEALDILLMIASLRKCLLDEANLDTITDRDALRIEMRNVDVNLGKVLRNFELLCEQYNLPNPLKDLEGSDAQLEMKKLVRLDKEYYGKKDSDKVTVITKELYKSKRKELGSEFMTDDEIYPLANIQLYDTMILLMLEVVQYDYKAVSDQIKECVFKLRRLVADRKAIDAKYSNSDALYTAKDMKLIEDIALQMGEIKALFDGVADEAKIPNKLYYDMDANEFWKKLSYMFDVLNSIPATKSKSFKKNDIKKDKVVETTAKETIQIQK